MPAFYDYFYQGQGLTTDYKKAFQVKKTSNFFDKDYAVILNYLKNVFPGGKQIRLLEFGSSWGYFLYQAKLKGFSCIGVEISKKRAKIGGEILNVDIVNALSELKNKKFDVIVSFHTLEHLLDIHTIFKEFHNLLDDDGIVLLEVPLGNINKKNHRFIHMGAVHPLGFTFDFFCRNLPGYGFDVRTHKGFSDLIQGCPNDGTIVVYAKKLSSEISMPAGA